MSRLGAAEAKDSTPLLSPQASTSSINRGATESTGSLNSRSRKRKAKKVMSRRYDVRPPSRLRSTDLQESLVSREDVEAGKRAGLPGSLEKWEFPGWGVQKVVPAADMDDMPESEHDHEVKLDQFRATAICGNDITSSCLYVAGLCTVSAGKMAPVCLILVAMLLYLFRGIYGEVVTALPVNGGAYNVLLNTTSKTIASLAACLTLLSYVATGVVSGTDAAIYAATLWGALNIKVATICLLLFFALLVVWGISDSANVALVMFTGHILTLFVLVGYSIKYAIGNTDVMHANWDSPFPDIIADREVIAEGNALTAIFFGFSSALLGISGFETSANFVEEQAHGVFVKTLRNMWIAVAFFNPVLSLLSLMVLPVDDIYVHQGALLARMGQVTGGDFLRIWVAIDATVVLSGAVLTSFVGVTGLARRMAMDRCLPQFLLNENSCRKTNHWIIFGFFLIASSLFLILAGNVETLSGVYNLAFLSVMSLFAIGCMMLKWKRPRIPRAVRSSYTLIVIALVMVVMGLFGNIIRDPKVVQYFVLYFSCTLLVVFVMFQRIRILRILLHASKWTLHKAFHWHTKVERSLTKTVMRIHRNPIVFFTKSASLTTLNKAILYVKNNEQTHSLCIVHACDDEESIAPNLRENVHLLDGIYPKLRIDLVVVYAKFGPRLIKWLAKELGIPTNMMFIACPDEKFPFKFASLGGVRVITNEHSRAAPPLPALGRLAAVHALHGSSADMPTDAPAHRREGSVDLYAHRMSRAQSLRTTSVDDEAAPSRAPPLASPDLTTRLLGSSNRPMTPGTPTGRGPGVNLVDRSFRSSGDEGPRGDGSGSPATPGTKDE